VRQFLDVGTGLPTADNTHEVAQRVARDARIVYVDNDPLVLAHARALLVGSPEGETKYVHADLRDPDRIIAEAATVLDLDRYEPDGGVSYEPRSPEKISGYFTGLELVDPGVVFVDEWRPDPAAVGTSTHVDELGGVGRKA
jgi:hypothetical protein